jgi:hypothetical protein
VPHCCCCSLADFWFLLSSFCYSLHNFMLRRNLMNSQRVFASSWIEFFHGFAAQNFLVIKQLIDIIEWEREGSTLAMSMRFTRHGGSDYGFSFPKSFIKRHEIESLKAIAWMRGVSYFIISLLSPSPFLIHSIHMNVQQVEDHQATTFQHRLRTLLNFSFQCRTRTQTREKNFLIVACNGY